MFLEEHKLEAEEFVEMVKDNPSDDEMIAAMKKLDR
jgi:arsenate reductase-like glutaredoxin family protein